MTKFKVGDKVRVTKCLHGHGFDIDEVVEIIHHNISRNDYECENNTDSWFLRDTEFELYEEKETEMALTNEMTAEQIRNEIIRINSRIEEANKDIEKAQEERNSLVEKLREKGFEIIGMNKAPVSYFNVGDRVEVTGYSPGRHTESHIGRKGIIEKIDDSGIPFKLVLDRESEYSNTWFEIDQIKKI